MENFVLKISLRCEGMDFIVYDAVQTTQDVGAKVGWPDWAWEVTKRNIFSTGPIGLGW